MSEPTVPIKSTESYYLHARPLERRDAGKDGNATSGKNGGATTGKNGGATTASPAIADSVGPQVNGHKRVEAPAGQTITLARASNAASDQLPENTFRSIVCNSKINNVRYLNKHFEAINRALIAGGTYTGCVESYEQFRGRLDRQYPAVLRYPYYLAHFIIKRFLPKWEVTRRLYFRINKGKNRVISLPEVLGRLVSCGFEPLEYREIDGLTWYAVRKIRQPYYDMDPTYGALVRLRREGLHGNMITIYKLRTMHPYAEYLQEYAFRQNGLDRGDKFPDDFRVTRWGRLLRTYWIDEIPMIWNYLKGDIKLVGVRPISEQKLSLYSPELRKLRREIKPGLIPPYYADLPDSLEEMQESETRYIQQHKKVPFHTDLRTFFKVLYNIVIKRARSS